jgi:DNA-binding response OmpR family regulator
MSDSSQTQAHRILVVEDDRAISRGIEVGLTQEGFHVTLAETGSAALNVIRSQPVHAILLDARLPDLSGFDVCRQLRAEGKRQPILMVTARDEEVDKVLGLELGADDYIVKPFSLRELTSRLRAALRRAYGELAVGADADGEMRFGDVVINTARLTVERGGQAVPLTPTEFKLLRHLVMHPRQPFTRGGLIEAVWGYDGEVGDDRTVDVHVRHLREKLEADPANPRWLVTVRGVGYKFEP